MEITTSNYYKGTFGTFKCCKKPHRKPDHYSSRSESCYWYGEDKKGEYVIRYSKHWSTIISKKLNQLYSCRDVGGNDWFLKGKNPANCCGKIYFKEMTYFGRDLFW